MTAYDGLADLLSGRRTPDVYRWHALRGLPEVRDEVESAGWRWGYVGGWVATDRAAVLGAVADTLAFPPWFGHNLDALADCLRDLGGPALLVWDHWARFARSDGAGCAGTLRVLRDRALTPTTDDTPPFAVLLWGEGPPTGTRSLD